MDRIGGRAMAGAAIALLTIVGASACSAVTGAAQDETIASTPTGDVTPSASASPRETELPAPSPSPEPGPAESYLAWLDASRVPDVDAACSALTPALQDSMIAELNAGGLLQVSTCEELIATTAELYRATGQSAEVSIEVQSESASTATLFVTYLGTGNCGTVAMERASSQWIITEQSEECAA